MAQDQKALLAAVEKRHKEFEAALNSGNVPMETIVGAFYASDAKVLAPQKDIVSGTDQIIRYYTETTFPNIEMKLMEVNGEGDWAYSVGSFTCTENNVKSHGKYVLVWKRVNGEFFIYNDIYNT